jgi:hypothetical protein
MRLFIDFVVQELRGTDNSGASAAVRPLVLTR